VDFSFKIEGLDRLHKATANVVLEVNKEVEKALFASAVRVEKEAKLSITSGQKSGRTYTRGTITHRASAPGEAPASDTGRLVNSITSYVNKVSGLSAFVVAGRGIVKYARALEFGTTKMAARPFMFPAVEKSKAWIQERLNQAVRTAAINSTRK
jgi:HK97 gp10 family phage protein